MDPIPIQPAAAPEATPVEAIATGEFHDWMSQASGSIVVTTYQSNLVVVIGWDGQRPCLLCCPFDRPMGLAVEGQHIALATRDRLLVLGNAPPLAADFVVSEPGRHDALFLPRLAYHTGDVNTHDVASGIDGVWFVNTMFSCLAVPSIEYSFVPRWKPSFITDLVPEDRCHLNGLAMLGGRPRFVTALGTSNEMKRGWSAERMHGGVVIDALTGRIVVSGLCMPHSPRMHVGWLWLLNSGTGELLRIDVNTFKKEVICALPGFARGLCFVGPFALVGLGAIRHKHQGTGLPIEDRHEQLRCGVAVVDLRTRSMIGMMEFTRGCSELYDVQFLPRFRRPMIIGAEHPSSARAITCPDFAYWIRPVSAEKPSDDAKPN